MSRRARPQPAPVAPPSSALERLVLAVDLAGSFVFALEGAATGIAAGLDLLGVLVLSFVTALGGGVIRDVLIGATPPRAFGDWRYAATALAAGAATFGFLPLVRHIPGDLLVMLDAAGLALFAVAGAEKALAYRLPAFSAVLLGGVTGVGGGALRDVLLGQVPRVLRTDIYATAALAGALVLVLSLKLGLGTRASAIAGGLACFVLRMAAVSLHWSLPTAAS